MYYSCILSQTLVIPNKGKPISPKSIFGRLLSSSKPSLIFHSKTNKTTTRSLVQACLQSNAKRGVLRSPGYASYHPSVWHSHDFASSVNDLESNEQRMNELKVNIKKTFSLASKDPFKELELVDTIQRLGIAHHFETETQDALQRIYDGLDDNFHDQEADDCAYLHIVALRFRLLRQAGYYVSYDTFNKFKDAKSGEFKSNLTSDTKCMLSLYQASHLGFNGEDIMDEAEAFTTKHLKSLLSLLPPYSPLAKEVECALKIPLQKSIHRVETKHYISIYQAEESRNESLLEFAKLDFNSVQRVHRKEISEILSWWEVVDFKSKLPYEIRDRVVEAYAQIMACYFEPQFSSGRILLSKLYLMSSVLDDTFDVYGNLDELKPLVDAFQRWDFGDAKRLPEYIKVIFLQLLTVIDEAEQTMRTPAQRIGISYLKQEFKVYTKGLLEEAKVLLFEGDMPTLEEWLPIAEVTITINTWIIAPVLYLGDHFATKEVFDWIVSKPKIITASCMLCRLFDDIASFKGEQDRGIMLSSVTCCMKDEGVSESEAIEIIQKRIRSLWKDMGKECIRPNPVPIRVLNIVLNVQRIMELYYGVKDDGYSVSTGRTKDIITALLVDPIPL